MSARGDDDRRAGEREPERARRAPEPAAPAGGAAVAAPRDVPGDHDASRRTFITWLWRLPVILAVAGGSAGLYDAIRIHFEKERPAAHPVFAPRPPHVVGSMAAFGSVWDSIPFILPGQDPIPAIVLRLPGPIPGGLEVPTGVGSTIHLAGFSRVCTHMGCTVYLNRDLKEITFAFNYRTSHPDLTCPCHLSIFDPTRSGEAVSGPAVRPLPRLQLELRGRDVVVVGLERS